MSSGSLVVCTTGRTLLCTLALVGLGGCTGRQKNIELLMAADAGHAIASSAVPVAVVSDEQLCAHAGAILQRKLEAEPSSTPPSADDLHEFMSECTMIFAGKRTELDPDAAAALSKCVMAATSVTALVRCGRVQVTRGDMCSHLLDIVEQARPSDASSPDSGERSDAYDQCRNDLDVVRSELGPLAVDQLIACVIAASTVDELERCKY